MFAERCVFGTRIHKTLPIVSIVIIYVKFSIQQCLNYLSSLHSLSASVKGSWLFFNRFLCSMLRSVLGLGEKIINVRNEIY